MPDRELENKLGFSLDSIMRDHYWTRDGLDDCPQASRIIESEMPCECGAEEVNANIKKLWEMAGRYVDSSKGRHASSDGLRLLLNEEIAILASRKDPRAELLKIGGISLYSRLRDYMHQTTGCGTCSMGSPRLLADWWKSREQEFRVVITKDDPRRDTKPQTLHGDDNA